MTKKNLVLLPALMCDYRLYAHQIKTLSPYYNILNFNFTNITNIVDAANFVLKQCENEKFSLVGTSMGGYIAMEIMRINSSLVEKLCLINTSWQEDSLEKKQHRLSTIEVAKNLPANSYMIDDNTIKSYLYTQTEEKNKLIKTMFKELGNEVFINQQQIILSRTSSENQFAKYNVPTLIVSGKYDEITQASVHRSMYNALPCGEIVVIDECSHLSPIDQPVALSATLQLFLGT
jgi:pimeloyl-ACP methyl ester carboxylesterase